MIIGRHDLSKKVLVVAEIGNNHEGRFEVAKELVLRAAECHVDAVKFQTYRTRYFTSGADPARLRRLSSFELTFDQFAALQALAHSTGLLFMSTPLDLESARFLDGIVDAFKIASGDNDFFPLLAEVADFGRPVVISSGMTDLAGIRRAVTFVRARWAQRAHQGELAVLHCVSSYPAPEAEINLTAITTLERELQCPVGYSDHTVGTLASIAAVALGARIIEKHFTLDKKFSDFRDHTLSADPAELASLVATIRNVEALRGTPIKQRQPCEIDVERLSRRSIVAASDLPAGHRLSLKDLTWIRPPGGLSPGCEEMVVGKTLRRALAFGERVQMDDLT